MQCIGLLGISFSYTLFSFQTCISRSLLPATHFSINGTVVLLSQLAGGHSFQCWEWTVNELPQQIQIQYRMFLHYAHFIDVTLPSALTLYVLTMYMFVLKWKVIFVISYSSLKVFQCRVNRGDLVEVQIDVGTELEIFVSRSTISPILGSAVIFD